MSRRVAVVAAHPDDETLGCGATIARHVESGDAVHVVLLGQGAMARDGAKTADAHKLRTQAHKVGDFYGLKSMTVGSFPDNRFDSVDLLDVVKWVETELAHIRPDIIYTHYSGDLNVDHRITYQAVVTACRPCLSGPARILSFEVPSCTDVTPLSGFNPGVFVPVTKAQLQKKVDALRLYSGELRLFPHGRSAVALEHLAGVRGMMCAHDAAEAFELVREVW